MSKLWPYSLIATPPRFVSGRSDAAAKARFTFLIVSLVLSSAVTAEKPTGQPNVDRGSSGAISSAAPVVTSSNGPVENQAWVSPAIGMEFVWIPALKMWVGKYEVTNGEYREFKADHNSGEIDWQSLHGDRRPVVMVNFDDAKAFAEWLTERDRERLPAGYRYRLPSEEEWMIFAQCGDGREYPWGNNWPPKSGQAGNYADDAFSGIFGRNAIDGYADDHTFSCDVEQSWANPWGLFGVGGNVWEITANGTDGASFGAWRGASWGNNRQDRLRCSCRFDLVASSRSIDDGFRLVLSPASP